MRSTSAHAFARPRPASDSNSRGMRNGLAVTAAIAALALAGCGSDDRKPQPSDDVPVAPVTVPTPLPEFTASIARTSFGIPHVQASDYKGLGYGLGYAFAQDNFCTLAEKINQVNGERSRHFGETSRAVIGSAVAPSISSLDSDFFHKLQYDRTTITALWQAASVETRDLAAGYAAGVNRYLADTGLANLPTACRNGGWVRPITATDLYVWWSAIATIAGSQAFAQAIADAQPPSTSVSAAPRATTVARAAMKPERLLALAGRAFARVDPALGDAGSNGWAIGRDATINGRGMLLSNPHWAWTGMNKFYQAHLTIPGVIDTMGVTYAGAPFVIIGFNETMGWTHTVSTGPRFVIRELTLGATPTSYVVDGVTRQMTARPITVELPNGASVARTYYTTEFGPLLRSVPLGIGWTSARAYALTDINLANNRLVEQWLALGRAGTAEAARQSLASILGVPFVNTLIADSNGDAVYADYSLKPNLSDAKLVQCALPGLGQTLTASGRPTIDGSRSSCNPDSAAGVRQAGVLPPDQLPLLRRTDYVANANNSYWYTNPSAPITGLPLVNGTAAADLGLRPRMNLVQIADRLAGRDGLPGNRFTLEGMQAMLIGSASVPLAGNRGLSAELLMPALITLCNGDTVVNMPDGSDDNFAPACTVLRAWDRRFNAESTGTHVFREFFAQAGGLGERLWAVPFSAVDPIGTPREPNLTDQFVDLRIRQALAQAQRNLAARGIPLNRTWGQVHYTTVRGQPLGTGGGTSAEGVPNQMNGAPLGATGYNEVLSGSSYVATMAFGPNGPEVEAVLIPGQSTNPDSRFYFDQLESLWTQRRWHRLPFRAAAISADPNLTRLDIRQ